MSKSRTVFSLLQAIAAVAMIATLLWSVGLPLFRTAEAANVQSLSDTLSDSAPSVGSNHTFSFVTPNGVSAGGSIVITFPGGFTITTIDEVDVDLTVNGTPISLGPTPSGAVWGVSTTSSTITLTSGTGTIASSATVTIAIGTNATNGGTGNTQITNPTVGSYEITLDVGTLDSGATRVAILDNVLVSATVQTSLDFTVEGLGAGQTINGTTTTGSTTATTIPFGILHSGVASTAAQQLSVTTNAKNGFVVTVTADGQLQSATGADIDGFANGAFTSSPSPWVGPTQTLGNDDTYGHWGITTNDNSVTGSLTNTFDVGGTGNRYVSASTTPVEVMRHNGVADGTTANIGRTQVGYQVQISALQEAADDYEAVLTYIVTPTF